MWPLIVMELKLIYFCQMKHIKNFNFIKQNPNLISVGLGLLAVPALAFSLNSLKLSLKSDDSSIDELFDEYDWFRSVCESYFNTYKRELTKDDLLEDDCFNYCTRYFRIITSRVIK